MNIFSDQNYINIAIKSGHGGSIDSQVYMVVWMLFDCTTVIRNEELDLLWALDKVHSLESDTAKRKCCGKKSHQ